MVQNQEIKIRRDIYAKRSTKIVEPKFKNHKYEIIETLVQEKEIKASVRGYTDYNPKAYVIKEVTTNVLTVVTPLEDVEIDVRDGIVNARVARDVKLEMKSRYLKSLPGHSSLEHI